MRIPGLAWILIVGVALAGCTSSSTSSSAPDVNSQSASSTPSTSAAALPSPEPRSSRMAVALGIASALPDVTALGSPWKLDGIDNNKASALTVAYCENVSEDETERIAGVSRTFIDDDPVAPVHAAVCVGRYLPGGAAKVLAALRTCSLAPQPTPTTVQSAANGVTRCAQDRPLCFTFRVVKDTLVGAQFAGLISPNLLAAASIKYADATAAGVTP